MDTGGGVDGGGAEIGAIPDGDTEAELGGDGETVRRAMRVVILYVDSSRVRSVGKSGESRTVSRATMLRVAVMMAPIASAKCTRAATFPETSIECGNEMETALRSPRLFFLILADGCSCSGGGDPDRPVPVGGDGSVPSGASKPHSTSLKMNK